MSHLSTSWGSDESEDAGHDRPWVFFMVDCFFLITEFFILTFKFKTDDAILPQKMPPGGTVTSKLEPDGMTNLRVSVDSSNPQQPYTFMNQKLTLDELSSMLARSKGMGKPVKVSVSYTAQSNWGVVAQVFNECQHLGIAECGLVSLH